MVIQYPHTIKIKSANWADDTSGERELKCRCELGANAKKGFNREDQTMTPKAIVYIPLPVGEIRLEDTVEVYDGANVLIADRVKQFSLGQLNARIWL